MSDRSRFTTPIDVVGPWRKPAQLLGAQEYDGHASIHDDAGARDAGLPGAPIEGPTHFSQVDPLAALVWGEQWFERGCISAHFDNMVVAGEQVQATLHLDAPTHGRIGAAKPDGTTVFRGTVSLGDDGSPTELEERRARQRTPDERFILDQLEVGMRRERTPTIIDCSSPNGLLYPFSLADKLACITEPHPWYEDGRESPWGRAILPIEMVSVLVERVDPEWPVRSPSLGLFLDLEIRLLAGPLFVDGVYEVEKEIVGFGESRRIESFWTRSTVTDATDGREVAQMLLHSGIFKSSYPGYPADRLA